MSPAKKAAKKSAKKSTAKRAAKKAATKRTAKKAAKKGTRKKSSAGRASAATGSVIVTSKLRDAIRAQGARMSSDLADALNSEVQEIIAKAAQRAKDNGRSTVRPSDL